MCYKQCSTLFLNGIFLFAPLNFTLNFEVVIQPPQIFSPCFLTKICIHYSYYDFSHLYLLLFKLFSLVLHPSYFRQYFKHCHFNGNITEMGGRPHALPDCTYVVNSEIIGGSLLDIAPQKQNN